jgi:hypothetical protein
MRYHTILQLYMCSFLAMCERTHLNLSTIVYKAGDAANTERHKIPRLCLYACICMMRGEWGGGGVGGSLAFLMT